MSAPVPTSKPTECACPTCVSMCYHRPCWPTPADAKRIIEAGFGVHLMLDWWCADEDHAEDIELLSPAIVGHATETAPMMPRGKCVFLDGADRCELHDQGLKPTEGRLAIHGSTDGAQVHQHIAESWDTDEGRAVVAAWKAEHKVERGEADVFEALLSFVDPTRWT